MLVVGADSFAIIAIPKADFTALACREKKVAVLVVFDTSEWTVMAFQ